MRLAAPNTIDGPIVGVVSWADDTKEEEAVTDIVFCSGSLTTTRVDAQTADVMLAPEESLVVEEVSMGDDRVLVGDEDGVVAASKSSHVPTQGPPVLASRYQLVSGSSRHSPSVTRS